jgi:hypothetical protein
VNPPRRILALALATFFIGLASAQPDISIRFFDKRIYYTDSEVFIKVTISNPMAETYRFKLAEERMFSLAFEARTPSNRLLDVSDTYMRTIASGSPVFYREIALEPGEEYSFVEDLRRYVKLADPGVYRVRALFYPELIKPSAASQASADLVVSIRPGAGTPTLAETISVETGDILRAQRIPPDEVIRRTLEARQKERWNEFFVYMDLEALLCHDPEKKRMYDKESDDGRRRMLERYRQELEKETVDSDIATIPYWFDIQETRYADSTGMVRVLEKFQYMQIKLVKEYTYQLQKRDDVWYVVGYSVMNKGTE